MEENKICSFNLTSNTIDYLKENKINLYEGSIGKLVRLEYGTYADSQRCKPNVDKPRNLHEFNKIIIDLTNEATINYSYKDHKSDKNKINKDFYFVCHEPQNIFDPRAFVLNYSKDSFAENLKNGSLLVVFCGAEEHIDYEISIGHEETRESFNIYSFLDTMPNPINKYGEVVKIPNNKGEIYNFLKSYTQDIKYHVIFNSLESYIDGKYCPDPNFHPLMLSNRDEIVSFYNIIGDSGIFFFPDIHNKGTFLKEFLDQVAPTILPKLFPDKVKNSWLEEQRYSLPNQQQLLKEKDALIEEYKNKILLKNEEVENNRKKYLFLTDLLITTDDALVSAVIKFLKWIGFENVNDADSVNSDKLKQEDIQINTDKGLIIIEVKGLGGTSKDSDCSQIGKIKYRRAKEREKFDVFAHYIVNHQRHLPAEKRTNPPFSKEQIEDSINDERGLITTWQLFNLFFAVKSNIISKEDARNSFYEYGLISFIPKNKISIGKPKEVINKHAVVILDLEKIPKIKVNDKILIVYKDHFQEETVISIQNNGKDLNESEGGEIGLKLTNPIAKGATLYI